MAIVRTALRARNISTLYSAIAWSASNRIVCLLTEQHVVRRAD
eukprot:COSAG04_NODE_26667_length_292_cov_0.797927_1_plen_42_part_01